MTDEPTDQPPTSGPGPDPDPPTFSRARPVGSRKTRDAAALLPLMGLVLLCSPVMSLFTKTETILGLPSAVLYIFGVWLGLILLAVALSRQINKRPFDMDGPD